MPLQEIYSEAPPAQPRRYRSVLSNLQNALSLFLGRIRISCYLFNLPRYCYCRSFQRFGSCSTVKPEVPRWYWSGCSRLNVCAIWAEICERTCCSTVSTPSIPHILTRILANWLSICQCIKSMVASCSTILLALLHTASRPTVSPSIFYLFSLNSYKHFHSFFFTSILHKLVQFAIRGSVNEYTTTTFCSSLLLGVTCCPLDVRFCGSVYEFHSGWNWPPQSLRANLFTL